jgi:predicted Zn-dependent peptidase
MLLRIDMYHKSILKNGIRVITESMPSVRSVAMGIIVDAGLGDEHPLKHGQAHIVEHLLFQGTSNRDSHEIARFMDEAGGRIGGFTTRDYTCYSATVLDDYRTYALELLGDILLNSLFLPEDIEKEKETILREIDAFYDLPDNRADTLLKSHIWADHPLGRPITGQPETVRSITHEDIVGFFSTHYRPDRLIVAAAGNIDHYDFVTQTEDAFWRMDGQAGQDPGRPVAYHTGVITAHMQVSQVYFTIGIPAQPYAHPHRYGLHILNKIIGDGISSRLFRCIREEKGLAYHIGSDYQAYRDGGLLVIEGSTNPGCFQQVLEQTLSVITRLITGQDPVDPEEILRAKNQIKGQHFIAAEDTHTRMSRLATQEYYFGRHISTREIAEHIEAVTVRSLEEITQQCLLANLSKMAIAVVGPENPDRYEIIASEAMRAVSMSIRKEDKKNGRRTIREKELDIDTEESQHPRERHWCSN